MTLLQLLEDNYLDKRIPDQEFKERAQKIRQALDDAGLEVGIAYATEHMPGDVQYLTGYDPHLENVALLVTPDRIIALGGAEGAKMFEDGASASDYQLPCGMAMMLDVGLFGVPKYFGARHENPHMIDRHGDAHVLTDLEMKVYT